MKEYIDEIVANGNDKDMECLRQMLLDLLCEEKEYNHNKYHEHKMKLYVMAYGEVLTNDMKDEWVSEMTPKAKWTFEEVSSVITSRGVNVPVHSAYVIMNMLYSDLKNSLGDGDTEESLNRYITATYDWYYDSDIEHTKENKLFKYYYNIVK